MVKVRVIEEFTLKDFKKLQNIERESKAEVGRLYPNDRFECDDEMLDYLTGNNQFNKKVVEIIEVIPKEAKEEEPKKTTKKKNEKNRRK